MASATEIEALDRIADILDGTTTTGYYKDIRDSLVAIAAALGTPAGSVDTVIEELDQIRALIDGLTITVTDSGVAGATQAQTRSRPPAEAPDVLKRRGATDTRSARSPRKPGV